MSKNRDGQHEGGSPVDTTRANSSPEELEREDAAQKKDGPHEGKDRHHDREAEQS